MPECYEIDRLRFAKTVLPLVFPENAIFESIIELLRIKILKRLEEIYFFSDRTANPCCLSIIGTEGRTMLQ